MSILTHGSDLSLAPTIKQVVRQTGSAVRGALEWLAVGGFETVQLDATLSGIRPRQLDRRARQDLLALLGRCSLRAAGLDLFIPHAHYLEDEHLDRAMGATLAGVELAADLGRVPLSIALPVDRIASDALDVIVDAADGRGVQVAVHAEDHLEALLDWVRRIDLPCVGCALDPAALLTRSKDPVTAVPEIGRHLLVARVSDASGSGAARCTAGEGELDLTGYRIALDLAPRRTGPVVLDLRGHEDARRSALAARTAWEGAGFEF